VYGEPVPRVELLLKKDANVIARARSADDGHFYFSVPPDVYTLATSAQHFEELTKKVTVTGGSEEMLDLDLHDTDPLFGGEFVRTIIGLEQSGASSSDREFHYFSDAYFDAPLVGRKHADPYFGPRLRVWGDARITSVPQTLDATVSDFATNEALATNIGALKANEVAQAVEVLAGVEYRLLGSSDRLFPSFARDTKNRFTVSLIAGGGLVTPVSATEGASVYTLDARSRTTLAARGYDVPADATYFAFVPKERDRFFRQFYAGLRLKTFYADSDGYPTRRAPAMFDVSIGGHEAFTGGRFRNAVLRLDGFYPLPYEKARWLYIFGTAILGPKRTVITDPLVAVRAPDGVKVTDSAVHVIPVDAINKDYYRIGFAVDAIDLIRTIKKSTDK
jgi:hypothetical protein